MLGTLDVVILVAYFAAILGVGMWFGRGERDTTDYFLGGRRQHWLIVGLSIIATEVSALTFVGVPSDAFFGDWTYLQLYAGAFLGRILIIVLLLPAFYAGAVTTVYEYLGQRFGPWTRTTASLLFIISRVIGSGIRLLAASLAIAVVFDWPLYTVITIATGIAVVYTTYGGIKAIIWTDALQALVFIAGGVAVLIFLLAHSSTSWTDSFTTAHTAGKFRTFVWDWNPNNDKSFWVLMICATFTNMAALGTDQDLTQRMLTCPNVRHSQRSLLFNAFVGLPIVCLFLLIGSLMFVFDGGSFASSLPSSIVDQPERVFPHFIATILPPGYGLRGLLIAGIFAAATSSLDSALGALSSTVVIDFYKPLMMRRALRRTGSSAVADEKHLLRVARWSTMFFGILLAFAAIALAGRAELLWEALEWVGLIFGGMLGVFLLGVTTSTRGSDRANVVAMLSSVGLLIALKMVQEHWKVTYIAWPWWVVIGTAWTYLLASLFPTGKRSSAETTTP